MGIDLYMCIALADILIFMLFLLSGSRLAKTGTYLEEPFSQDNITILILISYALLVINDFFSEMPVGDITRLKQYFNVIRNSVTNAGVINSDTIGTLILIVSGIFWFATGIYIYRRLKNKRTIPSKAGIIRVIAALLIYPLESAVAVYANGADHIHTFEKFWRSYKAYVPVTFAIRSFRVVPILIVLTILSWIFIKVIRQELTGILVISGSILYFLHGYAPGMKLIGGLNCIFFPLGLLAAKYGKELTAFLKRRFKLITVISVITAAVTVIICFNAYSIEPLQGVEHQQNALFTIPVFLLALSFVTLIFLMLLRLDIVTAPKRLLAAATFEIVWMTLIPYWYDHSMAYIGRTILANVLIVAVISPIAVLIVCLITKKSPRDYMIKKEVS